MNRLIYAASRHDADHYDADMLYATCFTAVDSFLYFEKNGRKSIALKTLEYARGLKEARVDHVLNYSEWTQKMLRKGCPQVKTHHWISDMLHDHKIKTAVISPSFPTGLADSLRKKGIRLVVAKENLFQERESKTPDELTAIRQSLKITAELLGCAIQMIRSSKPNRKSVLILGGSPLTSERIQTAIRVEAARRGCDASHPIVAGGGQVCEPHSRGHGNLKANELIVIDIFPRSLVTGYWGDMTRTVVKGRATEAQRRLFKTAHQAQKLAISKLRSGINGNEVHRAVEIFFESKGYFTNNSSGYYQGFFHSTGHGLGLDLHESPRINASSQKLQVGNVVTVEPGLRYTHVGNARIEDVVVIRKGGCEILSRFPVQLEI